MAASINIAEAKARLSALVDRAAAGEEIVLARAGKPVARLVSLAEQMPRRGGQLAHWNVPLTLEELEPDEEDLDAAEGDLDEFLARPSSPPERS